MSAQPDYIRWYPGAIALATSLLSAQGQAKERAKDIVQQAVAQLIERGEFLGVHRQAWFFTVVRNACIDELRQQRRYIADAHDSVEGVEDAGPAEHFFAAQRQQQIKHALQTLSFEQREILLLRDVNDLSYADIAQVLTINAGTVMSRLHRARMALRLALQSTSGEPTGSTSERKGAPGSSDPQRSSANQANPLPKEAL
ncbi:MAG: RNA polymerase sigma factor [Idiomarina sp.]|nr:RNA polymerase sigma factor [Idiomarina sp.]